MCLILLHSVSSFFPMFWTVIGFVLFRSRSRSNERPESRNVGNTLYVTGLSSRVTERDLEEHFSKEGKVASCFLVVEPRTRISRGFAFITMDTVEDANRCIKYLNQSVLEGRYITVERNTLHQLFWQQSKMISSSMSTLVIQLDQWQA
ncbi:hypothetical protein Fmac_002655 [Flemingia macrophylla]|uniref:RRM domain-containing protein n=1 Tax=Flemingia macrophylla TaxID=520843 RepID=A0ABD1NKK0_9FABA